MTPRGRALLLAAALALAAAGLARSIAAARRADLERVEGWAAEIGAAAAASGLDPFLLAGLVYAESRGRADARSSADARGLCQLKDATARETAARIGVGGGPPYPPADNLRIGAAYLAEQIARADGDEDLGLLRYRLGPGRVQGEIEAAGGREAWLAQLRAQQGPGPWRYCAQVREAAARFRARARDGVTDAWRAPD